MQQVGTWLSLVERTLGVGEVASSNLVVPTISSATMTRPVHEARTPEDTTAVARFKELTEVALPDMARLHRWPIRFDHCFKRICLDWAFGDVWYNHLKRPAERHLRGEALGRVVACAEALAAGDPALLRERDAASLRWRGKSAKR